MRGWHPLLPYTHYGILEICNSPYAGWEAKRKHRESQNLPSHDYLVSKMKFSCIKRLWSSWSLSQFTIDLKSPLCQQTGIKNRIFKRSNRKLYLVLGHLYTNRFIFHLTALCSLLPENFGYVFFLWKSFWIIGTYPKAIIFCLYLSNHLP